MKLADPIVVEQSQAAQSSEPTATAWQGWFTPGRVVILIGALLFAQYPEVFLGTHSFFNHDFGLFTYPTVHYLRDCLRHGEIPLWNPLNDCGVPFLAQWNTSVCYPPTWLCLVLPLPWSLNMLCLGHLLLAGYGMYLLAFRWTGNRFASSVAAVAYALNGFTFNSLMWISNMGALAWMPLTLLFVERAWREGGRRIISASIVAAMQMLSGAPEMILMTWMMLGTLWLSQGIWRVTDLKRSILWFGAVAAAVTGLCAVQILPFLELLAQSDRKADGGTGAWSLPAWGLANFLVPLFRCARSIIGPYFQIEQQWTTSFYPGIVILVLAAAAAWIFSASLFKRQKTENANANGGQRHTKIVLWFLWGWTLLGILLALGDQFILYPLLKKAIPGFGFIRYPIKFLVPTMFSLPLLAAFAATWVTKGTDTLKGGQPTGRFPSGVLYAGAGVVLGLLALVVVIAKAFPYQEEVWSTTAWNAGARAVFLAAGVALLAGLSKAGPLAAYFAAAFLVLLGLDAITHMPRQNPTVSVRAFDKLDLGMSEVPTVGNSRAMVSPEVEGLLRRAALPDRFAYYVGNRRSLFEDCNLVARIPKINGFFSLHLSKQQTVNALIYSPSNAPSPAGLIDFLGVSQISSKTSVWKWVSRSSALPFVTAGQQPIFAGSDETRGLLADPHFDGRKTVCMPAESRGDFYEIKPASVQVGMLEAHAHKIHLQTESQSPSILILAQSHYPAWRASVDGRPTAISKANLAFQAIQIPAGKHQITFVYRDRGFEWGALISALTLTVCFAGLLKPHYC